MLSPTAHHARFLHRPVSNVNTYVKLGPMSDNNENYASDYLVAENLQAEFEEVSVSESLGDELLKALLADAS